MKKIIFLLLLFTALQCKGQSWLTFDLEYTPDVIADVQDVAPVIGFKYDAENLRIGANVKLNDSFNEMYFGLAGEVNVLRTEWIDVFIPVGFAVRWEQNPPTKFETDFHKYYIHCGAKFEKSLTEHIDVNCHLQNQFYGQHQLFVAGVGASYNLK